MEMKRAAAYIRVSTDDQLEFSPDSQLEKIREYAESHQMKLDDRYIFREDEGVSGRKAEKRPEFMQMIGTAKTKPRPFDVILVWKFSRFARNRQDSIIYKSMLRKQLGIDVVSVSEPVGDDKMSVLIEAMIEAMDEYYSINLAEEVRRGMTEKASRGGVVSIPPLGYTVSDGQYHIVPEKAALIQRIYNDFERGLGYAEIARALNSEGELTVRGNPFENRTVEYILRNPVYTGKIRWNPSRRTRRDYLDPDLMIVDAKHDPIISEEQFARVQELAGQKKLMYSRKAKSLAKHEFMLRGIVRCSCCGSTLVYAAGGLQCHEYAKGRCPQSHYISLDKFTESVLASMDETLRQGSFALLHRSNPTYSDESDRLLDRQREMLDRAKDAYLSGIDTLSEYKVNKERIQQEMMRIEGMKKKSAPPPKSKEEFISESLKKLQLLQSSGIPGEEKNKIIRTFVDHITFDRAKNSFSIYFYA